MAAEARNVDTVLLSEEPKKWEWLIEIMKEKQEQMNERRVEPEQPTRSKYRIPKVDKTLRQTACNNGCFEPSVVSFGPYHHGKNHLKQMEPYKNVAAAWFISRANDKPGNVTDEEAISVYEKFIERVKKVSSPTDWYDEDEFFHKFESEEHYKRMLFLDGCFILYFIHLFVTGLKISPHFDRAVIARDMFLLENQIPFPILKSLMSLLPDQEIQESSIINFIITVFLPSYEMNVSRTGCLRVMIWILKLSLLPVIFHSMWTCLFKGAGKEPLHLLHVLREVLLGVRDSPDSAGGSAGYLNYDFRPIMDLKAAGIQVRRSRGMTLKHIKFKKGLLNSYLEIPQIIVDDSTKARLLNLVAFEMCPHGPKDRTVTSYICLLDSLIDSARDVCELQKEKILLNRLDSKQYDDVSAFFKELATNLVPDSNAYAHVIDGIKVHYKRHFKRERMRVGEWVGQFKSDYFASPWTLISLIAAVFVTVSTLLQTIYTIWAFYKTY